MLSSSLGYDRAPKISETLQRTADIYFFFQEARQPKRKNKNFHRLYIQKANGRMDLLIIIVSEVLMFFKACGVAKSVNE